MEFNKKLQELRKQKGITQEEVAEKLFVSRTAVSKRKSGKGYPDTDSLKAIANFFGVTRLESLRTLCVSSRITSHPLVFQRLRDFYISLFVHLLYK